MNLATLRAKALRHDLQVEDILRAAKESMPGLADELDRLTTECSWTDGSPTPHGRVIPFRRWASAASSYARSGYPGLLSLVSADPANLPFVLALLTELYTPEAVAVALVVAAPVLSSPLADLPRSIEVAANFNLLLSFPPYIPTDAEQRTLIREFLHRTLAAPLCAAQRATVLCALRGVGNLDSLRLISAGAPLPDPWLGLEATVRRALKKRLKQAWA